jgi:hypothetical protein
MPERIGQAAHEQWLHGAISEIDEPDDAAHR